MNAAQTYKQALRRKRTYFIPLGVAFGISIIMTLIGMGKEYYFEQEVSISEEATLSSVPYAEHFMTYAPECNWPWELLAAVAYHESRYNPNITSPSGARGLMQLMPVTGKRFGLNDSTCYVPKDNIAASVKYIARLQNQFRFVSDSTEQIKFVLASYNAGPAHIHDARRLAKKYGGSPYRWSDAEEYLNQLKYEEFYTDSVVQYGYFNSAATTQYVHGVLRTYHRILAEEAKLSNNSSPQ